MYQYGHYKQNVKNQYFVRMIYSNGNGDKDHSTFSYANHH